MPRVEYVGLDVESVSPPTQPPATSESPDGVASAAPGSDQAKRPKLAAKKPLAKKSPAKKGPAKKQTAKKKGTRRSTHTMFAVRTFFNNTVCFAVSQLYRMAVYQNTKAGPDAQSQAVTAVLWHELDRLDATCEERERYHDLCSPSWCPYQKWVTDGHDPEHYARVDKRDHQGKIVPWNGGHFARLDIDYPDAFQAVKDIFDVIGCVTLMRRCRKKVTQNTPSCGGRSSNSKSTAPPAINLLVL